MKKEDREQRNRVMVAFANQGVEVDRIADAFDLSASTVSRIIRRHTPHASCPICGGERHPYSTRRHCLDCDTAVTRVRQEAIKVIANATRKREMPKAKELACVDCGKPAYDYDHREYSKPLNVVPVCRACNLRRGPARDLKRLVLERRAA